MMPSDRIPMTSTEPRQRGGIHRLTSIARFALPALAAASFAAALLWPVSPPPRAVLEEALSAINAGDVPAYLRRFVGPEQLANLVECDSGEHAWLQPHGRSEKLERIVGSLIYPDIPVELISFEEEDRDDDWHSYDGGDVVYGRCRARRSFDKEEYRAVIRESDGQESSMPITFWRFDDKTLLWSDPIN